MEDEWAPRPNAAADLKALPLSAEEGFVLSRLDGATSVDRLPILTGFPPAELAVILSRLVAQGAVLPRSAARATPRDPPSQAPAVVKTPANAPELEPDSAPEGPAVADADPEEGHEPTHRALFETRLHTIDAEERPSLAQLAVEPELSAYCFDPLPAVIRALQQNPRFGLAHARLVARHHRNPVGLEAIAERGAFIADAGVRRWLIRNPQLSIGLVRRICGSRRLLEQYKVAQDRDVPEGTRRTVRETMRMRFSSAAAEERVELILHTDGRALTAISGLPVDGKTTAMLCARPYSSSMFIQNVARWSAAPPPLIAHLLRQEAVRRQPTLRQMLKRHPNAPSTP